MIITKDMMDQKLDRILIETPMRQELLVNTSLQDAHEKVNEDIKKLYESNFYEFINIHYGVKSKAEENLNQKIFNRRKQIIEYKIQMENNYIKNIYRAQNETDLEKIEKQYQDNLKAVQSRQKQFNTSQFIPFIYIEAKQKRPLYGKLFQQFDRKGVAMLKATVGYRSPFSVLDKIQFVMQTPPLEYFKKRNYYEFGFNWTNPISLFGNSTLFLGASASCGPIFKGVDDKKTSTNIGFTKGNVKMELQASKRYPRLHERISQYCRRGYNVPSTKFSFKLDKTLSDTLQRGEIMTGQLEQAKLQTTIPGVGQSQFFKGQYSYRKFFDIFQWGNYFKNEKLKLFFRNSNVQTNFSVKALSMKTPIVSDFLQNIEIRGFQNDRRPKQSMLQAKGSFKINNYNYPFFGSIGIIPFLYGQAGVSLEKDIRKPFVLGSTGVGLSFPLGKSIQLEVLYALFQAQNRPEREPVNFQIRIGLMD